jgi:DnaJ-class molecular chaperone
MNDYKACNYYDLLEINNSSTPEEIRASYKKLALKYHPDRNHGDKESEEQFKNISVAYQTLSNPDKKKTYDMYGTTDDNPINHSAMDIFNEIFQNQMNTLFGDNVNISEDILCPEIGGIKISLHTFTSTAEGPDILKNTIKNINKTIGNIFDKPSVNIISPPKIKNQAKKVIYLKTPPDLVFNIDASLEDIYCGKSKSIKIDRYRKIIKKPEIETKKVKIPLYGRNIVLPTQGNELEGYVEPGNLVINIIDTVHKLFTRINEGDLMYVHRINFKDIYTGFKFSLTHLDDSILQIVCNKNSLLKNDNLIHKIKKKGLPYYSEEKEKIVRGSLFIRFVIDMPDKYFEEISKEEEITADEEVTNSDEKVYITRPCDYNDVYKTIND